MKSSYRFIPILAAAILLCGGCANLTEGDFEKNKLREEDFFDFKTTVPVILDLDYGEAGAMSSISVFADYPMVLDPQSGTSVLGDQAPLFKEHADADGKLYTQLDLPVHVTDCVFICSSKIGTPACICAGIKDGVIRYRMPSPMFRSSTKVISSPSASHKNGDFYSIVEWDDLAYGKIDDVNQVVTAGELSNNDISLIQSAVWNGKTSKPSNLDNSRYAASTEDVDTFVSDFLVKDGKKVDEAEVFFTFVFENGWNQNIIGYYYYETGKQPASPSGLKKYFILPNASTKGNVPFGASGDSAHPNYGAENAPLGTNVKIQLLYVDPAGNVKTKFPAGYTIGYFIISDGYKVEETTADSYDGDRKWWEYIFNFGSKKKKINVGKIDYSKPIYYSDKEWNKNQKSHFMARSTSRFLIYGAEDLDTDKSYEDVVFTISANPAEIITKPNPDDIPDLIYSDSLVTSRTYCFEDLWPDSGDYDMNDVVIEHRCKIAFDGDNFIRTVDDDFKVCNQYKSAGLEDAFAVVIPPSQRGTMTYPPSAVFDPKGDQGETNAIILFEDAQDHLGETLKIRRTFESGVIHKDSLETDLDPFIIPMRDGIGYTHDFRREVHLPKKNGTCKINTYYLGMTDEAFFVCKDKKYPFAISIPRSVSNGEYILPREMYPIDEEYPMFSQWVSTFGELNTDWYLYYRSSK